MCGFAETAFLCFSDRHPDRREPVTGLAYRVDLHVVCRVVSPPEACPVAYREACPEAWVYPVAYREAYRVAYREAYREACPVVRRVVRRVVAQVASGR